MAVDVVLVSVIVKSTPRPSEPLLEPVIRLDWRGIGLDFGGLDLAGLDLTLGRIGLDWIQGLGRSWRSNGFTRFGNDLWEAGRAGESGATNGPGQGIAEKCRYHNKSKTRRTPIKPPTRFHIGRVHFLLTPMLITSRLSMSWLQQPPRLEADLPVRNNEPQIPSILAPFSITSSHDMSQISRLS